MYIKSNMFTLLKPAFFFISFSSFPYSSENRKIQNSCLFERIYYFSSTVKLCLLTRANPLCVFVAAKISFAFLLLFLRVYPFPHGVPRMAENKRQKKNLFLNKMRS